MSTTTADTNLDAITLSELYRYYKDGSWKNFGSCLKPTMSVFGPRESADGRYTDYFVSVELSPTFDMEIRDSNGSLRITRQLCTDTAHATMAAFATGAAGGPLSIKHTDPTKRTEELLRCALETSLRDAGQSSYCASDIIQVDNRQFDFDYDEILQYHARGRDTRLKPSVHWVDRPDPIPVDTQDRTPTWVAETGDDFGPFQDPTEEGGAENIISFQE
jgi:hypothetical protein